MQKRIIAILALVICITAILAGCTGSPASSGGSSGTSTATPAGSSGTTGSSTQDNLATSPTDAVPSQNMVSVKVKEKDYAAKIPVEFDGGMGQIHVRNIEITVYCANGETKTATLKPNKGDSVEIQGTKQTDRVVVYISFDNGTRLKTNDVLSPYRTR